MAKPNKTKERDASVLNFLNRVADEKRKEDALRIYHLMNDLVPDEAKMWGPSIIAFGNYHYKYESGREGNSLKLVFLPENKT